MADRSDLTQSVRCRIDVMTDEDFTRAWVRRDLMPDADGAILAVVEETGWPADRLVATPVLCREESEVEAKIAGHEFPYWQECTARAKAPLPFWRVTERPCMTRSDLSKSPKSDRGDA